ncbi:epidermal differentiation-specific protein-like [Electrophorus electricus]|uniref:epidermal differentiation-specific protein-like n=1 Tax=Electrophorus electricus TaxID=8005 RepID=UPI0015D01856|nr:epidermal differentiation-specific protein-like [Electrophorus electricus]
MNKIIVYEHINFEGLSKEFTSNVSNLVEHFFNDTISSLKVIGNPWVAYTDINFSGSQAVYEEGEYNRVNPNDSISSLEMITDDLTNPQITLYEHSAYRGSSIVLTCETNLAYGSFNDTASSHKVQRGAWVLYEHSNRGGAMMVARASCDVPKYGWFNDKVSHVRPLNPGRSIITAEVLWGQKEEHVSSVVIDILDGRNDTDHEQNFSTELDQEYEQAVTDTFSFRNESSISVGANFEVNVGLVKAESSLTLSNTFTVEKGSSNTRTEKKAVRVSLPAKIPPHTKLTCISFLLDQMYTKLPSHSILYNIPLQSGVLERKKEQIHEYRSNSGNSINAEFKEQKI